jgi:hypothetical protein
MDSGNTFWVTGYYKDPVKGAVPVTMHGIDLADAIRRFPDQYSKTETFLGQVAKPEEKKAPTQKA